MQAGDAQAQRPCRGEEGVDAVHLQAELRSRPAGAHLGVVPFPAPQVDAQPQRAVAEDLRPAFQRLDIVERHGDPAREGRGVLRDRREARREQHALRIQPGQHREHVVELACRHAFKAEAFVHQQPQDVRVRIGLDGIEAAVDRGDRGQLARARAHRGQGVGIARRAAGGKRKQFVAPRMPPGLGATAQPALDLAPARPEDRGFTHRHGAAGDEFVVEFLHESLGVGFVDDEGQVEIVG